MTSDQDQITKFVEDEKIIYCPVSPGMFSEALHRAITLGRVLGLRMALEVGERAAYTGEPKTATDVRIIENARLFNKGFDAKDAAIRAEEETLSKTL